MNRISPTTLIGYVRLVFAAALLGHIVLTLFTKGVYFLDAQMGLAYGIVWALGDKIIGAVAGHFTADSPPAPKASSADSPPAALILTLCLLPALGLLGGCATADRAFRARVAEVDPQMSYQRSGEDDFTVTAGGRIILRPPEPRRPASK